MSYLIHNLSAIYGFTSSETSLSIRITDNRISHIGAQLKPLADDIQIDAQQGIAYPGWVNTHHHLAQSILKGIPAGLNQGLGDWLASVPYQYWPKIDAETLYLAAKLGLYEGLRSGMTTCADHHYLYHAQSSQELEDAVWQAANELGVRFVLCRGGANVVGSHKGFAKAGIEPEPIDLTLKRLADTYAKYHQNTADAMARLVVAPTSLIHSATPEQLRLLSDFARSHQLKMHSHLLEVPFDEQQAQIKYGMSAVDYAQSCGWLGDDVWFAHLVHASDADIKKLAANNTGIAHCPTSNLRLGSGIAPVLKMAKAGMPISIGVDGSASSESASLLQEQNLTWLLHRAHNGAQATTIEQTIAWGSVGGAQVLGFENLGQLAVDKLADLVIYQQDALRFAGVHEPELAPVMLGEPAQVSHSFINGRQVVNQGRVAGLDEQKLFQQLANAVINLKQRCA